MRTFLRGLQGKLCNTRALASDKKRGTSNKPPSLNATEQIFQQDAYSRALYLHQVLGLLDGESTGAKREFELSKCRGSYLNQALLVTSLVAVVCATRLRKTKVTHVT
jgi:hypothetical protein